MPNLTENAVAYSTRIRITVELHGGETAVTIDDDPSIPPSELERVFEPFVHP